MENVLTAIIYITNTTCNENLEGIQISSDTTKL